MSTSGAVLSTPAMGGPTTPRADTSRQLETGATEAASAWRGRRARQPSASWPCWQGIFTRRKPICVDLWHGNTLRRPGAMVVSDGSTSCPWTVATLSCECARERAIDIARYNDIDIHCLRTLAVVCTITSTTHAIWRSIVLTVHNCCRTVFATTQKPSSGLAREHLLVTRAPGLLGSRGTTCQVGRKR